VDAVTPLVVSLTDAQARDDKIVGGKVAKLSRLVGSGCRVPPGFCLTIAAYESFVRHGDIETAIRMELGRKSLDSMRWEELWDAALRIRSVFVSHALPDHLQHALGEALEQLGEKDLLAVRSSALGEDSGNLSFAGLHESVTDVRGEDAVVKAVRLVWASLWSDAALLYRRELGLDPASSRMAVLVQRMVHADRSGVAFGEDPRGGSRGRAIIEAVPGPCRLLVDGTSDPDRWEIERQSRKVLSWRPGEREDLEETDQPEPLLVSDDLDEILDAVQTVEELFGWSPDVEWTGRAASLTILQARPITTATPDPDEERRRSMSLRPADARLRELRQRVADTLIPQLEAEGQRFSEESIERYDDAQLADAVEQRSASLERWKKTYWDDFIPFAHGVRRLAIYYNDTVLPDDPYEFVGLLQKQPLLAAQRNLAIHDLARKLARNPELRDSLEAILVDHNGSLVWSSLRENLLSLSGGEDFVHEFEELSRRFLDITYEQTRLQQAPEPILRNLLELSQNDRSTAESTARVNDAAELEERLLRAVGDDHRDEAVEMIAIGRLSWKLRDDDNLLVSRIESQLLRALEVAVQRLRSAGRVVGEARPGAKAVPAVVRALRDPGSGPLEITEAPGSSAEASPSASAEVPRQLVGQPASPGLATGTLRVVRDPQDLGAFRQGEILLCDAIQPTMTHLAMLAAAIIERRGGMLIHGAIIARELGIPCVNGIRDATRLLRTGDLVTVDGYLGIVTVGAPELDLELRTA